MRRTLVAAIAVLGSAGAVAWGVQAYRSAGPLREARDIVVARGTAAHIADQLRDAGVIRYSLLFRAASFVTRGNGALHAAEFHFAPGVSLAQALDVLRHGKPVQHFVTFPEGITAARVATILVNAEPLSGDVIVPPEGYVLPQTYGFPRATPRADILHRAHAALQAVLAPAPMLGLSAHDVLVLASLVERETALPAERPMVARVFLNRLKLHMKLQSDPTTIYGASGGEGNLGREISHADLARTDSYNTYAITALPAGPICAPGASAIDAVLHPAETDALYFVATGHGGHAFARTLSDHTSNVARFRDQR